MNELTSTPSVRVMPAFAGAPASAPDVNRTLVDHGAGALDGASVVVVADFGFQADSDGTAFTVYDAVVSMLAPEGEFFRGLAQYGVHTVTDEGWAWLTPNDAHAVPEPSYDDLVALVAPYVGTGRLVLLVTRMQPRWEGFAWGQQYAAFHTTTREGFPFAVIVVPPGPSTDSISDTGNGGRPPGWTSLQATTVLLSHELVESLLDTAADGSGWSAPDGESDDYAPCVWVPQTLPSSRYADRFSYWVQGYWRNDTGACWAPQSVVADSGGDVKLLLWSVFQLQTAREIRAIAVKYEVCPPLAMLAGVLQESFLNPGAVGDAGVSFGCFQLDQDAHPNTAFVAVNAWYDYGFPEMASRWRTAWQNVGGDTRWNNDPSVAGRGLMLEEFVPMAQGSIAWSPGLGQERYLQAIDVLERIS
jgi:hypothetical protein